MAEAEAGTLLKLVNMLENFAVHLCALVYRMELFPSNMCLLCHATLLALAIP